MSGSGALRDDGSGISPPKAVTRTRHNGCLLEDQSSLIISLANIYLPGVLQVPGDQFVMGLRLLITSGLQRIERLLCEKAACQLLAVAKYLLSDCSLPPIAAIEVLES